MMGTNAMRMDGEALTVEKSLNLDRREALSITDKHWYSARGCKATGP
jgi:hypothetical protein